MNRRVDAHLARTQFGQIMDRAVESNERFVVERRGEPAVVILSVQDFTLFGSQRRLPMGWRKPGAGRRSEALRARNRR
jgi:prevent-host-death family protein